MFFISGIVVEDCLLLLLNLLKNNTSNQNFFREGSHIKYLTPFFEFDQDQQRSQMGWSAQKVTNIHLLLQVCLLKLWIFYFMQLTVLYECLIETYSTDILKKTVFTFCLHIMLKENEIFI